MKLKSGKKYETADGVVYKVRQHPEYDNIWDVCDKTSEHWDKNGEDFFGKSDLVRRHYTKPKPAHKLDLKPGDVVKLVAWEDIATVGIGKRFNVENDISIEGGFIQLNNYPKGHRPLFKVVSRAKR